MTWREKKTNVLLRLGIPSERRVDLTLLRELVQSLRPKPTKVGLTRIGRAGDGGYLVPNDLDGLAAVLSPGVSSECGFDLEMARRGVPVFMADASVDGPPLEHDLFHFQKKFIEPYSSANSIDFAGYANYVASHTHTGDWLMQMDIEGAEWRVLLNAPQDDLLRCRIILIEFHNLHRLFSAASFEFMASVFKRLLKTHEVVHIHPNNAGRIVTLGDIQIPSIMEFTFLRRDRFASCPNEELQTYPHRLDSDCVPGRRTIVLPKIWQPA
jgi:hypothetical protein